MRKKNSYAGKGLKEEEEGEKKRGAEEEEEEKEEREEREEKVVLRVKMHPSKNIGARPKSPYLYM